MRTELKKWMIDAILREDPTSLILLELDDWKFEVLPNLSRHRLRGAVLRHQPRSVARNRLGTPTWVMDAEGNVHALYNTFGKSAQQLVIEVTRQLAA